MKKHILLVVTGQTIDKVETEFGNCQNRFRDAMGAMAFLDEYAICDKWEKLPNPSEFDGVLMTGSAAMLDEDKLWMRAAKNLVQKCLTDDIPFLGVCFGHQVLGAVCGAKVGPNPNGRANGSTLVHVKKNAAIFNNLPSSFWTQISHRDVILENRPDFRIIAETKHDERHAIQVGNAAFGVQFHPEWDMNISRAYIDARRTSLGEEKANQMMASLTASPHASLVIKQFANLCGKKSETTDDFLI